MVNNDTNICFTIPKAKFLLKQVYKASEYKLLDSICNKQLDYKDSIVKSNNTIISNLELVVRNEKEINRLTEYQIEKLKATLKEEIKNTRRQKLYKWCAIISGCLATGFTTYKFATK